MSKTIQTAIAGVTGYAGAELCRLLLAHPSLQGKQPLFLGRMTLPGHEPAAPIHLWDLHPQLAVNDGSASPQVIPFDWQLLKDKGVDILFMATPHEQSREWVPVALEYGMRVIDLSGAWRLHDATNSAVYKLHDADPVAAAKIQAEAVYGSPELHRAEIASARFVSNPGCYSTSAILGLAPLTQAGLINLDRGIVIDAKSGVSGSGKTPSDKTHFMYAADNLSAYGVFGHRHTGELLEQLHLDGDQVRFTPHLLPIPRGILTTIYVRLKEASKKDVIHELYRSFYASSPLVRVHPAGHLPQIQHIVRNNYCDIGIDVSPNGRDVLVISCLDNLLKGAAGQAVQNMNLMAGFAEAEGLL